MTPEQVKELVSMTIDELIQRNLLKDNYHHILNVVNNALYDYFHFNKNAAITKILNQLSDDPYIDIIYLQYRDEKTIEWIAEYMEKDVSTIKRNKKRLIVRIYGGLNE